MDKQLWEACSDGKVEDVIKLLQNEQINTNWQSWLDETPFLIACEKGYIEIVKLLLNDNRVDINKANNLDQTPFYVACKQGHVEIVKLLLNDQRVDINKKGYEADGGDTTPLYIACYEGRIKIVELLLADERVDVNKANQYEVTPFYIACYYGHIGIVKLLLSDKRIDINQSNDFGATPFYRACDHGHIEIVKLLLKNVRIDINKADKNGQTPFYITCSKGYIEIAKLLLNEKQLSVKKKTKKGKTAIDIAKTNNHSEIVKLIKEFDTERRYREYLETLQGLVHIENEIINKQDFLILNEYLKRNKDIKELRLINCGLMPFNTLEILKTLIWKYENLQLSNTQNIEIDDIKLESTEGLDIIPIEIRNQGTKSIIQYILDLSTSPNSKPLYRTKLMVVGYEKVGKTTILDCLFPIIDFGETKGKLGRNEYLIELEGKYLRKYFRKYKPNQLNKVYKEIILEDKQWNKEDWIQQSEPELRKSFIQYLGDYISKFRKLGWNYGYDPFVIPMIQGTTEAAAWGISDGGFGTVCKIDAGYYSQGVYVTSKVGYAEKYSQQNRKVFVIGFVMIGNPFPVIEHPFLTNEEGKVLVQEIEKKPKKNENGYLGKPINPGYQSHFTLVDGRDINTAFPLTKVEQLNEKWIADELVVHDPQIYPSYIVYYK